MKHCTRRGIDLQEYIRTGGRGEPTGMLAVLTLEIHLPLCHSLKEKRSRLRPLLTRLHREFNVSAAETARHDQWQESVITCALVTVDAAQAHRSLQVLVPFVEAHFPELQIEKHSIELI